jgi:hypothetical protein
VLTVAFDWLALVSEALGPIGILLRGRMTLPLSSIRVNDSLSLDHLTHLGPESLSKNPHCLKEILLDDIFGTSPYTRNDWISRAVT